MEISIRYNKERNISDAIYDRVEQKMKHIDHYLEEDHPVHIILTQEKKTEIAEVTFHFHGHDIFAKAEANNLYEAIDQSIKHATRQIEKIVDKMKDHKGNLGLKDLPT